MNRIKRMAMQLLDKHGDRFGPDFEANKETLGKVAIFRSKILRNEVAGYITNYIKASLENSEEAEAEVAEAVEGEQVSQ